MIINNVTRLLDAQKARYTVFDLPAEKLGAAETAAFLSIPEEIVFKSIVVIPPKGKPVLCTIPGNRVVDLKKVAAYLGDRKVSIASLEEAERLTGLQVGGISPLALINKGFILLLDVSARDHKEIHISGGERGLNIRINTEDLVRILQPRILDVTRAE